MLPLIDYQIAVSNYFINNPAEIIDLFSPQEGALVFKDAAVADNWSLDDESGKFTDQAYGLFGEYEEHYIKREYGKNVIEAHRLELLANKYYGQVIYLVLETEDGKLIVGEYVGD